MSRTQPLKKAWKPRFLEELRECANVSRAAATAGVSRQAAYKERNASKTFREDWDVAIEEGVDYLEEEARRRALQGTVKPVFQGGKEVGAVREFSDTLMIFLLKGRRSGVFGERVKQEHTGAGGRPIEQEMRHTFDLAAEIRELDRLIAAEEEAGVDESEV